MNKSRNLSKNELFFQGQILNFYLLYLFNIISLFSYKKFLPPPPKNRHQQNRSSLQPVRSFFLKMLSTTIYCGLMPQVILHVVDKAIKSAFLQRISCCRAKRDCSKMCRYKADEKFNEGAYDRVRN